MESRKTRTEAALVWATFVALVVFGVALVVRGWSAGGWDSWLPELIVAALLVLIARGGKLKVSKEGFELSTEEKKHAESQLRQAAVARGQQLQPGGEKAIQGLHQRASHSILWVDDQPINNIHETAMLANLGFRTTSTTSTAEAKALLSAAHFDLVITDLTRDQDLQAGLKLLRWLSTLAGAPPTIVYTMGHDQRHDEAKNTGATAVITMPDELLEAILSIFASA